MIVTDRAGDEWGTYADVLEQIPGLKATTLRDWVRRGKVRAFQPYPHSRRGVMVCLTDVLPLVRDATGVGWRRGRRQAPTPPTGKNKLQEGDKNTTPGGVD